MLSFTRRSIAAACAAFALAACGSANGDNTAPGKASGDGQVTESGVHFLGKADAPLVIEEYASVTCIHCKTFHEAVKPVLDEYVDAGLVRFDFHDFPTPPADLAVAGFAVARCAGDGKYFDVLDDLFANQGGLIRAYQAGQPGPALGAIAERHGLDQAAYEACLGDEAVFRKITDIVAEGENRGVRSTPTFFINGDLVTEGRFQTPGGARDMLNARLADLGLEPLAAPVNQTETVPESESEVNEDGGETDEPVAPEPGATEPVENETVGTPDADAETATGDEQQD